MKVQGKLSVLRTQNLKCEITYADLVAFVRERVAIPDGVTVRIYVEVPGGGDWSHTDLEIEEHPVQVSATWVVEDAEIES